jgi:hypothetical protein
MERDNVGALARAAAAVCLLCCVVGGAASAYSVPADPRHPTVTFACFVSIAICSC